MCQTCLICLNSIESWGIQAAKKQHHEYDNWKFYLMWAWRGTFIQNLFIGISTYFHCQIGLPNSTKNDNPELFPGLYNWTTCLWFQHLCKILVNGKGYPIYYGKIWKNKTCLNHQPDKRINHEQNWDWWLKQLWSWCSKSCTVLTQVSWMVGTSKPPTIHLDHCRCLCLPDVWSG